MNGEPLTCWGPTSVGHFGCITILNIWHNATFYWQSYQVSGLSESYCWLTLALHKQHEPKSCTWIVIQTQAQGQNGPRFDSKIEALIHTWSQPPVGCLMLRTPCALFTSGLETVSFPSLASSAVMNFWPKLSETGKGYNNKNRRLHFLNPYRDTASSYVHKLMFISPWVQVCAGAWGWHFST